MPQGSYAREFSDETERLMDHAIRGLVGHAFDRAVEILNAHRAVHEKTAQLLLKQETLEEGDVAKLRAQIVAPEQTAPTPDKPAAAAPLEPVALDR
jgi:cell division protease FtsH